MDIASWNFCTEKFRKAQESSENCLTTYDNWTQVAEKSTDI